MEKEGIAKSIPKKKQLRAPSVKVIFSIPSRRQGRKHSVDFGLEELFRTVCAKGARNVERGVMKWVLGL
jgi:hypothetical protein